ncbi:hypothetical protein KC340_g6783 [Hortaea werneckii]|nr:hypothetical protein KC342_g2359 [Hortaea werneckii]KAI7104773.1 hypothetical protein KC339_g4328 [Hortaea werneckii]KAI7239630.1 hypothetical protein KC365_g4010 [Hortaea werneckii]KAI7323094.1 hypothetical protein KC340_g6783 [Hortaea werneckii]KAI7398188.1 hypothetical protein KC328_g4564 [Hortaea werneckii]
MESPNKRLKPSNEGDDFMSLDVGDGDDGKYGYGNEDNEAEEHNPTANVPRGPKAQHQRDARFDRRNAQDRPRSKHALPGHEPWILVKTKFGRRFVHNTATRESLWRIPDNVWPAVRDFDAWEKQQKEREENAKWAEQELQAMRQQSKAEEKNQRADVEEGRNRRRRSESLQREDEEAMMAELAAQAEHAEEQDAKDAMETVEPQVGETGYDSEGSFEYVEVTDDEEGEDNGSEAGQGDRAEPAQPDDGTLGPAEQEDAGPVEFGEDDIAYQLAAMGADYGLDEGEYGSPPPEGWSEGAEGLPLSDEDAANLFKDLLDDHHISPYTPWEKLVLDESSTSILHDDRYTVLPTMKARRHVFDDWARHKAVQIQTARAQMEKQDPRIPYLALLADKASPKLYWPEFKRKFKKEPALLDRKLPDKEKEKLYREHIARLKLPESSRKADLIALLKSIPLRNLNNSTTLDSLPQHFLANLHSISLAPRTRDEVVGQYIESLPPPPDAGDVLDEKTAEEQERKKSEKLRREAALQERKRQVEEERRKVEKEERFARKGLREEERELSRAVVGTGSRRGLKAMLGAEGEEGGGEGGAG